LQLETVETKWKQLKQVQSRIMDEGTLKTPIPKCRLSWSFLFGWCSNFVGPETGQKLSVKTSAEYGLKHISTPPIPHPHSRNIPLTGQFYRKADI
jgi:hypothetical protein